MLRSLDFRNHKFRQLQIFFFFINGLNLIVNAN